MIGPKEKKERAVGERLHLKGERCNSTKCAMVRKPYKPGAHGQSARRRSVSEFGLQTKEKQKFKWSYGLNESTLLRIFSEAKKAKGSSAAKMIEFLEKRLDNVVYRFGFTSSRGSARQIIVHGHVSVNGKKVHSPGFTVKTGDVVKVDNSLNVIEKRKDILKKYEPPEWLALDRDTFEGRVLSPPTDSSTPFEVKLLVEAFSK
ncbi:MAG: 30S ribosomal protein S4 [Patescibacteria group bacterium]|nr:30S ribosomal protein S4 [Patescibacteria group bacterium]MDE2014943.1 30S ribosomal protein S4 [Patescibacteria group bacterium]MDE2226372.1 30S ribosomal protein S4 [Patescibacteria group bacterium]